MNILQSISRPLLGLVAASTISACEPTDSDTLDSLRWAVQDAVAHDGELPYGENVWEAEPTGIICGNEGADCETTIQVNGDTENGPAILDPNMHGINGLILPGAPAAGATAEQFEEYLWDINSYAPIDFKHGGNYTTAGFENLAMTFPNKEQVFMVLCEAGCTVMSAYTPQPDESYPGATFGEDGGDYDLEY